MSAESDVARDWYDWLSMLDEDDRELVLLECVGYLVDKGIIKYGYGNEMRECLHWVRDGLDVRRHCGN